MDKVMSREDWLTTLAGAMTPIIERRARVLLGPYRVTCGFPSRSAMIGSKTRRRGECWSAEASEDQTAEVFVSPVEDDTDEVAEIVAHELIHVALPDAGHGKTFQAAAKAIGFVAPFTSSHATDEFWAWVRPLLAELPPYPHRRLNAHKRVAARKPQRNRQIKCACPTCGYIARASRAWIERVGPPHCPEHGAMVAELPTDDEDRALAAPTP